MDTEFISSLYVSWASCASVINSDS